MRLFSTPRYEKDAKRLLKAEEQTAMELAIVSDPDAHPVMPGMGGIRKARWARHGGGKSGGVRTIYYYRVADSKIYLLFVYAKNEQADLTPEQRKQARRVVEVIEHGKGKNQKEGRQ